MNSKSQSSTAPHTKPIAVFDSGLGGLTVLKALASELSGESFVYLGDTARLPYGSKSPHTIRRYCEQIIKMLIGKYSPKAIVIACNSASSQMSEESWDGTPLFNVIDPGVRAALAATQTGKIGILGTRATVQSGEYERRLVAEADRQGKKINCFSQACPMLVPLAEEGWFDDPITNLIVHRYLGPVIAQQVDTVILGCTHYPILINSIRKTAGNGVHLVEAGPMLVQAIRASKVELNPATKESGFIHVHLTDTSERSKALAHELLKPIEIDEFSWVDLE